MMFNISINITSEKAFQMNTAYQFMKYYFRNKTPKKKPIISIISNRTFQRTKISHYSGLHTYYDVLWNNHVIKMSNTFI